MELHIGKTYKGYVFNPKGFSTCMRLLHARTEFMETDLPAYKIEVELTPEFDNGINKIIKLNSKVGDPIRLLVKDHDDKILKLFDLDFDTVSFFFCSDLRELIPFMKQEIDWRCNQLIQALNSFKALRNNLDNGEIRFNDNSNLT